MENELKMSSSIILLFFVLYIVLNFLIYLKISKINHSYFHSYTIWLPMIIFIQIIPLLVSPLFEEVFNNFSQTVLLSLFLAIFTASIFNLLGYLIGNRFLLNFPGKNLSLPNKSKLLFLTSFFFLALLSFILLGLNGVGITTWLLNNREAYISGRSGNGIYYISYQVFIVLFFISSLVSIKNLIPKIFGVSLSLLLAYLTGSKGFLLGLIIAILFYYDSFIKKITFKELVLFGFLGLIAINALLLIQSNTTLLNYGSTDFYNNFLLLIQANLSNDFTFYYGQLSFEDSFWNLIPRALYTDKPFIYGQTRLVALVYGEQTVISGNTPSFTSLGVPYADFGIFGVLLNSFVAGFFVGVLERSLRKRIFMYPKNFLAYVLYFILYFIPLANFSAVYLVGLSILLFFSIYSVKKFSL